MNSNFFGEEKKLDLAQVTLKYHIFGEGPVFIITNAVGQDLRLLMPLINELALAYKVIVFNFFYVKNSNELKEVYYFDDDYVGQYCEMLKAIVDHECATNITLLSWCSGVKLSVEFLSRHADYISRLVMLTPSFAGMNEFGRMETEYENDLISMCKTVNAMPNMVGMISGLFKDVYIKKTSDDTALLSKEILDFVYAPLMDATMLKNLSSQMVRFFSHDVGELLLTVSKPAFVILASDDTSTSSLRAKKYCSKIKSLNCVEVANADHYLCYNNPASVRGLIDAFIENI